MILKMKMLEKKQNQIVFSLEIEDHLANAIRRYVYHIPILAIVEVEISKNDSPLYDETIAHRLGLIPLDSGSASEKTSETLKLSVNKEGMVYSGDIKGSSKVVYKKIPITMLGKDQELEFVASAKIGRGFEHAKFSPGLMGYREIIEVRVDKNCPQEILKKCPDSVRAGGKTTLYNPSDQEKVEKCLEVCQKEKKDYIKIEPSGELAIDIESFGQIGPGEIFKRSIEELKRDLEHVSKQISKT